VTDSQRRRGRRGRGRLGDGDRRAAVGAATATAARSLLVKGDGGHAAVADMEQAFKGAAGGDGAAVGSATATAAPRSARRRRPRQGRHW